MEDSDIVKDIMDSKSCVIIEMARSIWIQSGTMTEKVASKQTHMDNIQKMKGTFLLYTKKTSNMLSNQLTTKDCMKL